MPIVTRATVLLVLLVLHVATPAGVTAPPAAAGTAVPVGVWPLRPPPEVVRGFDPPDARWGAGHRGVDLLGSPGAAVRAALPGVVSFAGRIAGRGVVVVDHGETRTTYEPVLAAVRRGRRVAAGAVLGHLASAGSHCPPRACLHWGWLRGVTYLDPLLLVGAGPVRLLPVRWDEVESAGVSAAHNCGKARRQPCGVVPSRDAVPASVRLFLRSEPRGSSSHAVMPGQRAGVTSPRTVPRMVNRSPVSGSVAV